MKFLAKVSSPKLTYTKVSRKAIIDEMANTIVLHESMIKLELTLPSIVQGFKDAFYNFLGWLFLPKVYVGG